MHLLSTVHCTDATNNISRVTQETLGKLVNDITTAVAAELKTFSTQVSVSQTVTKQEFVDAPDFSTTPSTSFGQSKTSMPIFTPPLLPQLDRKDYMDVVHWGLEEYNAAWKANSGKN